MKVLSVMVLNPRTNKKVSTRVKGCQIPTKPVSVLLIDATKADIVQFNRSLNESEIPVNKLHTSSTLDLAVDILARENIDIIFVDLFLPDSIGMHTYARLAEAGESIPIIILSQSYNDWFVAESLQQGAQDFVVKDSLSPFLLNRTISHALDRKVLCSQIPIKELSVEPLGFKYPLPELAIDLKQEREERYRTLRENSGDIFVITDAGSCVLYASFNVQRTLLYSSTEIVGCEVLKLIHDDDHSSFRYILEESRLEKDKLFHFICRIKRHDGTTAWTEGTIINLVDASAVNNFVISLRDVTSKFDMELELKRNKYVLEKANEVAKIGYWVAELGERDPGLWWSPQIFKIFGANERDFSGRCSFFESMVHPDDLEMVRAKLVEVILQRKEYSIDHRVIRGDGNTIWVHQEGDVFLNEAGAPASIIGIAKDITEHKANEQKIRESKNNLDSLINSTSDIIWSCDTNLRLVSANRAFHKRMIERHGQTVNVGDSIIPTVIQKEYSDFWQEKYAGAVAGRSETFEVSVVEESGEKTYYQTTLNRVVDEGTIVCITGFSRNVTQQRLSELEVRNVNERFEILSRATNDAIWDWDIHEQQIHWNHGLHSIYGYEPENRLTSLSWWKNNVHPEDVDYVEEGVHEAFSRHEQLWSASYRFRCTDGTFRHAFDRGFIIYKEGKPVRMIGAMQDLHELTEYRINLERIVNERTAKLELALANEKELSGMKSRFVSIASHEFRTPLSTIQFATDFLQMYWERAASKDIKKKLESIGSQVQHMLYLLDDVLTVGKGESGKINVIRKNINLRVFIDDLTTNIVQATRKSHSIEKEIRLTREEFLFDEKLLYNILTNLLSNAIKFSPDENRVSLMCEEERGMLIFEVSDNGIGIDPNEYESILEAFTRGSNVGAIAGSGLGLSIVKTAVSLLDGQLTICQNTDFKTTFRVELPLVLQS